MLLGLETASSGTVTLGNKEIQSTGIEKRSVDTVSSIQMVFQNPFDTLNPSHSVGSQIIRTLEKFNVGKTVAERRKRMLELLDLVKLPRAFETRKPRQLSGGQKQRIGVARAFAGDAKVVVADEPVSALDVSVQAAVTELLMDIQRKNKTTMLFISHDLSVVRYIADRVVVMYLGYIVEQGTTDQIFAPPYHPYTEALLSAIPIADTSVVKKHIVLEGDIPSAMNPPSRLSVPDALRLQEAGAGQSVRDQGAAGQGSRRWPYEPVLAVRRRAGDDGAGDQLRQGARRHEACRTMRLARFRRRSAQDRGKSGSSDSSDASSQKSAASRRRLRPSSETHGGASRRCSCSRVAGSRSFAPSCRWRARSAARWRRPNCRGHRRSSRDNRRDRDCRCRCGRRRNVSAVLE